MKSGQVVDEALAALATWYESERPPSGADPDRYVVCAALAVLELLRSEFPIRSSSFLTRGSQVRTSGGLIKKILARFGETRVYSREGGRTTRGTRPAAERWVARLNSLEALRQCSPLTRGEVADSLQAWLAERVQDYFNRCRIQLDLDLGKPGPLIIADILAVARARSAAGPVAQHLVGAKLSLRHPKIEIENHSYTTADQQLGRPGDFLVQDTVFHVTVSPMPQLFSRCSENFRQNYRVILLVTEDQTLAARQMAAGLGLDTRVGVLGLEPFIGQNIEEMANFGRADIARELRKLLDVYNRRVAAVETDRSLLIEIPENLA